MRQNPAFRVVNCPDCWMASGSTKHRKIHVLQSNWNHWIPIIYLQRSRRSAVILPQRKQL